MENSTSFRIIIILTLGIFLQCQGGLCRNKYETLQTDVDHLIESEKFDQAKDKVKERLESLKSTDEIISQNKPLRPRVMEMSSDKNRVVWLEDKKLIFRDLANPMVKTMDLGAIPEDFSISTEAEFALLSFKLANGTGCRLRAISLLNSNLNYDSGAFVSCKNRGGISNDGSRIYYFIDDSLYEEETKDPKKPKLLIAKEKIEAPFPKIKNRNLLFPLGKNFLLFTGSGGSYFLYWFNTAKTHLDKTSKDIMIPRVYYYDSKTVYVVGGTVGTLLLREVKTSTTAPAQISKGISIGNQEAISWPMLKKNEFLSGNAGSVYKWGPGIKKQTYPILCNRFWGVARNYIIYENKKGDLILSGTEYSPDDWKTLELYKKVKKKI